MFLIILLDYYEHVRILYVITNVCYGKGNAGACTKLNPDIKLTIFFSFDIETLILTIF